MKKINEEKVGREAREYVQEKGIGLFVPVGLLILYPFSNSTERAMVRGILKPGTKYRISGLI